MTDSDYVPDMGELMAAYVDVSRLNGYSAERAWAEAERAVSAHDSAIEARLSAT